MGKVKKVAAFTIIESTVAIAIITISSAIMVLSLNYIIKLDNSYKNLQLELQLDYNSNNLIEQVEIDEFYRITLLEHNDSMNLYYLVPKNKAFDSIPYHRIIVVKNTLF